MELYSIELYGKHLIIQHVVYYITLKNGETAPAILIRLNMRFHRKAEKPILWKRLDRENRREKYVGLDDVIEVI